MMEKVSVYRIPGYRELWVGVPPAHSILVQSGLSKTNAQKLCASHEQATRIILREAPDYVLPELEAGTIRDQTDRMIAQFIRKYPRAKMPKSFGYLREIIRRERMYLTQGRLGELRRAEEEATRYRLALARQESRITGFVKRVDLEISRRLKMLPIEQREELRAMLDPAGWPHEPGQAGTVALVRFQTLNMVLKGQRLKREELAANRLYRMWVDELKRISLDKRSK